MLSSLSSAVNVAERDKERGAATVLTALKLTSLSLVKRGNSPRVKRCRSHVCNEGVLCCNDSALLSLSSATMILQFYDPDFLFSVQSDPLMVTGDQLSRLSTEL